MGPRVFPVCLLCVLMASVGHAQTATVALPTSVDILVIPATGDPATVAPVATRTTVVGTFNASTGVVTPNSQCGRNPVPPPTGTGTLVNPTQAEFDDPFTVGKKCIALLPTGLPDGAGYRAVAVATAPSCQPTSGGPVITPCSGLRSLVGVPPFSVASVKAAPAVLTNLVIRQ